MKTIDLFGNLPKEGWEKQLECAEFRITYGQLKLKHLVEEDVSSYKVNKLVKAIDHWKELKAEAEEYLKELK